MKQNRRRCKEIESRRNAEEITGKEESAKRNGDEQQGAKQRKTRASGANTMAYLKERAETEATLKREKLNRPYSYSRTALGECTMSRLMRGNM